MNRALCEHFEVNRVAKIRPLLTADSGKFFGFVIEFKGCVNTSLTRLTNFFTHKIEEAVSTGLMSASDGFEISDTRLEKDHFRLAILNRESREAIEEIKQVLNIDDTDSRTLDVLGSWRDEQVDNSWFTPEILNPLFFDIIAPTSTAHYVDILRVFRLLEEDGFFHVGFSGVSEIKQYAKYLPNFNLIMAMANMAEFTKKAKAGKILREHINPDCISLVDGHESVNFGGRAIPIKHRLGGTYPHSVLPIWVSFVIAHAPAGSDVFEIEFTYVDDPWASIRHGARISDPWRTSDLVGLPVRTVPAYDENGFVEGFECFIYG